MRFFQRCASAFRKRQRLTGNFEGPTDESDADRQHQVSNVLDEVAGGASIAEKMREFKSCVKDTPTGLPPTVNKLGSFSGFNHQRDFRRALRCSVEPIMVPTIVKEKLSGDDFTRTQMEIPLFLPEDVLEYLVGTLGLEIEQQAIQKYWLHAQTFDCPWKNVSPDSSHWPLGLYGDAAKYSPAGQKILACFLNIVLWAPKSSRMSRWLLFSMEMDHCLGPESLNPLFNRIVKSLRSCYNGLTIRGQTYKFVVSELRGDWEWHVFAFDLQRNWRMHTFCWRCDASRKPGASCNMLDLEDEPEWAETQLSNVQFLSRMISPSTASPLLLFPNFNHGLLRHCSLHNVNLGLAATANGSSLLLLADLNFFGDANALTMNQLLAVAYRDFKIWCKEKQVKCSQPLFRESLVWNTMSGAYMSCKGHNARCVCAWLSSCLNIRLQRMVPPRRLVGSWLETEVALNHLEWPEHDMLAPSAVCMDALNRLFCGMERSGRYLSREAAEDIYQHGMRFLRVHKLLTTLSQRHNLVFWLAKPKIHALAHQLRDVRARRYNIRYEHTFIDEDQMKWCKRLCQLSDRRNLALSISKKAPIRLLAMKCHMPKLMRLNKRRAMR